MKWLLIQSDGTVGRTCTAPDKGAADGILAPRRGQYVVSQASWNVSRTVTVPNPDVNFHERQGPPRVQKEFLL